jgi:hypothetical protein
MNRYDPLGPDYATYSDEVEEEFEQWAEKNIAGINRDMFENDPSYRDDLFYEWLDEARDLYEEQMQFVVFEDRREKNE